MNKEANVRINNNREKFLKSEDCVNSKNLAGEVLNTAPVLLKI